MAKLADASKGLQAAAKEISALENQFKKLEQLQSVAKTINTKIAKQLTTMFRAMLLANYSKGGIGVITGALKAAVASSFVVITPKGLRIKLGRGFDKHVYVRASVFRKYKDWYGLSAGDMAKLQTEFTRLWQIEVQRYLASGNRI